MNDEKQIRGVVRPIVYDIISDLGLLDDRHDKASLRERLRKGRLEHEAYTDRAAQEAAYQRKTIRDLVQSKYSQLRDIVINQAVAIEVQHARIKQLEKAIFAIAVVLLSTIAATVLLLVAPAIANAQQTGDFEVVFRVEITDIETGEVTETVGAIATDGMAYDMSHSYGVRVRTERGQQVSDWSNRIVSVPLTCQNRFDADGDGRMTASDVLGMLRIAVGSDPANCAHGRLVR